MDFKNQEILFKYAKKIGILAFQHTFSFGRHLDFRKSKCAFIKLHR